MVGSKFSEPFRNFSEPRFLVDKIEPRLLKLLTDIVIEFIYNSFEKYFHTSK
jgi:hypothetical protein